MCVCLRVLCGNGFGTLAKCFADVTLCVCVSYRRAPQEPFLKQKQKRASARVWFISGKTLLVCTCARKYPQMQTHTCTILLLLLLVGGSKSHPCKLPSPSSSFLTSPLPLSPLLIPLSHWTGSTYSTAPGSGEWGEKGYYDSEERKEREREKRGADRVLWERGMRAVKAFGVFIRLPKPRAPLPIRLVDTASHVNEMQSRETLPSLCQFVGPFLSSSADGFVLLSVCLPRNVAPFFLGITARRLQPLILPLSGR